MPEPTPAPTTSWEAYLALEAEGEGRYEYYDGIIVAMAGGTNAHNELVTNMVVMIKPRIAGGGCKVFTETVKLFRYRSEHYFYPDLMVTCHPLDLQTRNRSPLLVVEVLSQRNRHRELATKLREYIKLPSLQHYLLVN